MFKYVEEMRKVAIYIMSRSYGTRRSKEDGCGVYDKYKLTDFIRLLCFEDEAEALDACLHFGITVVDNHSGAMDDDISTSGEENFVESKQDASFSKSHHQVSLIRWRHSRFHEPIDPVKGGKIPLRTRKMVRTIESKLNGATRLAVCRGDMSTYHTADILTATGPTNNQIHECELKPLLKASSPPFSQNAAVLSPPERHVQMLDFASVAQTQEAGETGEGNVEKKITKSTNVVIGTDSEKVKHASTPRGQQFYFLPNLAIFEGNKTILQNPSSEQAPPQQILGENKKTAAEEERLNQHLINQVESKQIEEQAAYITKKRTEEKEKERKNLEAAQKLIEEERFRVAMERRKQQEEEKKIAEEVYRQKVQAEEEEKRIRLEKIRIEKEWGHKVNHAIKCLAWRSWLKAAAKSQRNFLFDSINNIDPAFCRVLNICSDESRSARGVTEQETPDDSVIVYKSLFRRAPKMDVYPINVAGILAARLHHSDVGSSEKVYARFIPPVILFKVAIVLPREHDNNFHPSILSWIESRIRFNEVFSQHVDASIEDPTLVRFILVHGTDDEQIFHGCDAAIFFIPPGMHFSFDLFPGASVDVPSKVAFVLTELFEVDSSISVDVTHELGDIGIVKVHLHPSCRREVNLGLTVCFEHLIDLFLEKLNKGYRCIERISFTKLGCRCIRAVLAGNDARHTVIDGVPNTCLKNLVFSLNHTMTSLQVEVENFWPAREFCCKNEHGLKDDTDQALSIPGYFGPGSYLPYTWQRQFDCDILQTSPLSIFFNPTSEKLEDIISVARCEGVYIPFDTAQDCELFLYKKDIRSFLENILICIENNYVIDDFIYLPSEMVKHVFHMTVSMTNKKMHC
jgi:hypothetical protein